MFFLLLSSNHILPCVFVSVKRKTDDITYNTNQQNKIYRTRVYICPEF